MCEDVRFSGRPLFEKAHGTVFIKIQSTEVSKAASNARLSTDPDDHAKRKKRRPIVLSDSQRADVEDPPRFSFIKAPVLYILGRVQQSRGKACLLRWQSYSWR